MISPLLSADIRSGTRTKNRAMLHAVVLSCLKVQDAVKDERRYVSITRENQGMILESEKCLIGKRLYGKDKKDIWKPICPERGNEPL